MACIRKRRGKYVVDFRDAGGVRRWRTCDTLREAKEELRRVNNEAAQLTSPSVDPMIKVADYAAYWLQSVEAGVKAGTLKARTLSHYQAILDRHVLRTLGGTRVRDLTKARLKALLIDKLEAGLAPSTVSIIHRTARVMLTSAVDDGVLLANPASRLGRTLRLVPSKATRQEEIKAMTAEQLSDFLETSRQREPRWYPLLLLLARTGLRIGEALALQWDDVDLAGRALRVARTLADDGNRVDLPKSGHGRDVDMSLQLTATLRTHDTSQKANALRAGAGTPAWIFPSETGSPLDPHNVRRAFRRILKLAKLPPHFTPHCLRHTFASTLISSGRPIAYVQRQLGHASIGLTVDTYGKWLPIVDKGAVDALDDTDWMIRGSKVVANGHGTYREQRSAVAERGNSPVRAGRYRMGRVGLEPTTRCLKGSCSNHLS